MNRDLLLVKLPHVQDTPNDFYGVGYYTDHGFVFMLITEDIINTQPLRSFPFPVGTGYDSESQFEVIGKIKNLPNKKKQQ